MYFQELLGCHHDEQKLKFLVAADKNDIPF
jgi:hypothetical protein